MVSINISNEVAHAHSGGTDKYGCHAGSMPYHCHNAGPTKEYVQHLKFNGLGPTGSFKVILKRHNNCESLNRLYLRGVAISKSVAEREIGRDTFLTLVSSKLYKLNRHLDLNNNGIACGFLEPENFWTQTFLCGTQSQLTPPPLTTDDTYSSCQSSDPEMGGWKIEVLGVTPNGETAILAEYHGNKAAPAGEQYFIARLRITNLNPVSARFPTERLGTRGQSGRTYAESKDDCGYLSSSKFEEFSPNESRAENFCWKILSVDADGLVLFFERDVYTLDWISPITGNKFYKYSKGYSYIGLR